MTILLLSILLAGLNRARGNDFFGHVKRRWQSFSLVFIGFAVCGYEISGSVAVGAVIGAGTLIWAVPAWGKYFMSVHGRVTDGGSVKFIDAIVDELIGEAEPYNAKRWGSIAMSLRGGIFDFPTWVMLALAMNSPVILAGSLISFTQGCIYYGAGLLISEKNSPVTYAEIAFGFIRAITLLMFIQGAL
jgi:hypothetical protein